MFIFFARDSFHSSVTYRLKPRRTNVFNSMLTIKTYWQQLDKWRYDYSSMFTAMHALFCQFITGSPLPQRSARTVCDYPHPVRHYLHGGENSVHWHFFFTCQKQYTQARLSIIIVIVVRKTCIAVILCPGPLKYLFDYLIKGSFSCKRGFSLLNFERGLKKKLWVA